MRFEVKIWGPEGGSVEKGLSEDSCRSQNTASLTFDQLGMKEWIVIVVPI